MKGIANAAADGDLNKQALRWPPFVEPGSDEVAIPNIMPSKLNAFTNLTSFRAGHHDRCALQNASYPPAGLAANRP
ncbi:MAG TPA: hypothetical protein DCY79_14555 [Planctomycetaceae bacterium]|nr:hypothetical protein [Blastopirellula sp.]MAR09328.1 hypothetical protein [Blastopirellula sp.]HAY81023.1 hypothetical protein [Planctomycetaceae bacterium]